MASRAVTICKQARSPRLWSSLAAAAPLARVPAWTALRSIGSVVAMASACERSQATFSVSVS